jgi:hypothetical protein
MTGCVMNDELERMWKEAAVTLSGYYPGTSGGAEENREKPKSGYPAMGDKAWLYFTAMIMMMKKKIIT